MKKFIFILIIFSISAVFAEVKLPSIFGDNMMFQQNAPINIWGTSSSNASISVKFGKIEAEVKADKNGQWQVSLPQQKASFKTRTLTISENGNVQKVFGNILVGEIWIAGGQSNMEWKIRASAEKDKAIESTKELNGNMRYFMQSSEGFSRLPKNEFQKDAKWITIDANNVEGTSAVGYWFAKNLMKNLNVPVAIIYSAKGGSRMATWTSKEAILNGWTKNSKKYVDMIKTLEAYDNNAYQKTLKAHNEKISKHKKAVEKAKKEGKKAPKVDWTFNIAPTSESPFLSFRTPTIHFNGKIAPMRNFSTRGVIWYQGESDAAEIETTKNFTASFGMVIDSWRKSMGNSSLPFLQVQLPSYADQATWDKVRQAQVENTKVYKNVFLIPSIDTGEEHNIHPKSKIVIGQRLGKLALNKVYNKKDIPADAPVVSDVKINGKEATVCFETFGRKLIGKGSPRGFEILVKGKWVYANAQLKENFVIVKSSNGEEIKAIRYLCQKWTLPLVWLFNEDGMPAIPFSKIK